MAGNLFQHVRGLVCLCALSVLLPFATGCGVEIAGPGETVAIPALASEDVTGPCTFNINMPDQPLSAFQGDPAKTAPAPTQVAVLVIYERGDSATLFNDAQLQSMAAKLHMVTVFARQCNTRTTGDIQPDATKGPGRALLAALTQYAADSHHPEIAGLKMVMSGFSAAGVLSITMANTYPDRVLGIIPYASGSIVDLETIPVPPAVAKIPALILANAYDPASGVQRSLRYFGRGWAQGAPWGFGVQNHTAHCCTLSTRDLMIPWVTALVQPLETGATTPVPTVHAASQSATGITPNVRFLCYTDGYYDAYGESNCWIASASVLPTTDGGPQAGWLPDDASAAAWLKWVTSPGTN